MKLDVDDRFIIPLFCFSKKLSSPSPIDRTPRILSTYTTFEGGGVCMYGWEPVGQPRNDIPAA